MKKRLFVFLLLLFSVGFGPGCSRAPTGRAKVEVSTFPIFDLTRRVAGPDADVTLLLPTAASDPSLRLAVLVGLGFDDEAEKKITEASPKARILKVGDRVPTITVDGVVEPHVWLDPQRARLIVKAIGEEMARADSSHANAYRKRAADVDASLEALDNELEAQAKKWNPQTLWAPDKSFTYFAQRYQLAMAAVPPPGPTSTVVYPDPIGGKPETDTYEKLLRTNAAIIQHHTEARFSD